MCRRQRLSSRIDSNQFQTAGNAAFDGNGGLSAIESIGNERNQFFVGLAIDRRGFDLREPSTVRRLFERTQTRVGLDLHPDKYRRGCHRGSQSDEPMIAKRRRSRPNHQADRHAATVGATESATVSEHGLENTTVRSEDSKFRRIPRVDRSVPSRGPARPRGPIARTL